MIVIFYLHFSSLTAVQHILKNSDGKDFIVNIHLWYKNGSADSVSVIFMATFVKLITFGWFLQLEPLIDGCLEELSAIFFSIDDYCSAERQSSIRKSIESNGKEHSQSDYR